jgi:hypothetical protein
LLESRVLRRRYAQSHPRNASSDEHSKRQIPGLFDAAAAVLLVPVVRGVRAGRRGADVDA